MIRSNDHYNETTTGSKKHRGDADRDNHGGNSKSTKAERRKNA